MLASNYSKSHTIAENSIQTVSNNPALSYHRSTSHTCRTFVSISHESHSGNKAFLCNLRITVQAALQDLLILWKQHSFSSLLLLTSISFTDFRVTIPIFCSRSAFRCQQLQNKKQFQKNIWHQVFWKRVNEMLKVDYSILSYFNTQR